MPLVQLANGPLSGVGPVNDIKLDDLIIEENGKSDSSRTIDITQESEKADPSHFALLKVLGQGKSLYHLFCFYNFNIFESTIFPKLDFRRVAILRPNWD